MAQVRSRKAAGEYSEVFARGDDHGAPVEYRIGPLSQRDLEDCRKAALGETKARSLRRQLAADLLDRAERETLEQAVRALKDTTNFSVEIGDEGAARFYAEELKLEATPAVGQEVTLDGRWTEAVKRDVLSSARSLRAWIANKASTLTEKRVREDEEDNEDF